MKELKRHRLNKIFFVFVLFYGISTTRGHLMPVD